MAYTCLKKSLVLKSHFKKSQTFKCNSKNSLAILERVQEKNISSNYKPYYLAIYKVKVLEIS